jgi:hypothetical protein
MLNQSFRRVFVTNTPVLLASGTTADLAVGQVGLFDGNTYAATTAPTYAKNKAIILAQGMPDVSHLPLMAGIPQTNQFSKLIKGKLLKKVRRKSAHRGQNQVIAIGFDGIDTTKSLPAQCGEVRTVYIKATGNPIDKLYNNQGFIRQYRLDTGCCDECGGDSCADVDPSALADKLVEAINTDPKWNAGGGQLFRARKVLSDALDTSGATAYNIYNLAIADNGNDASLAAVQVQYPALSVKRISRDGIISTYQIIATTLPAAFTNAGLFVINDCGVCPAGYTANAAGYIYVLVRNDAGDGTALTAVSTAYGISAAGESTTRILRDAPNSLSTYILISNTANQAAIGANDSIQALGAAKGRCVLTTPTTTAWTDVGDLYAFPKDYTITLQDTVCGTSRLAELQAYYPDLTISQAADGPVDCIHQYTTTIYSTPVAVDCTVDQLVYEPIPAFGNTQWDEVAVTPSTNIQAGVIIETAFVNRITGDCTYDYFPYEADTIHLQVSEYNADYNGSPCEDRWPVTELQSVKYPVGVGAYVRDQERKSLSYFLEERSQDPAVREAEGYKLQTNPDLFYDEFTVEYDFSYKVGGWSQTYTDSYHQVIYVPEGSGNTLQQVLVTYAESVGNDVDIELL